MKFDPINMQQALDVAQKSEDPQTKVGCVILNKDGAYSSGYNHMPERARVKFPLCRDDDLVKSKYPYIIHAEMDAITKLHKWCRTDNNLVAYVTLFPCSNCAKLLVQSGVKEIYYLDDKYADKPDTIASKKLLDGCRVKYHKVEFDQL